MEPGEGERRVELELSSDRPPLFLDGAGLRAEVRLEPGREPLEIVGAADWPQLNARFVVIRPDLLARDPRQGWRPCGGMYPSQLTVGRRTGESLPFEEVPAGEARLLILAYDTYLTLTACGERVLVTVDADSLISAAEALERLELQAA